MIAPEPVDPATTPALSGVFAPVSDERDVASLPVEGEIPTDLRGAFLRNGPNPLFPPLGSFTYPLEGDPMLHGIWIDDGGSVRYRNRFVWSPQLRLEQQAGRALWAGLMTPYLPGPDIVPAEYANDFKPQPFINIVHHGSRFLALSEVDPPWEVTDELDVVGTTPFTWGGAIPGMCAHPRIDPATGEMILFRYDLAEPYLAWATIAADGSVSHALDPIPVDGASMIHDFVITPSWIVLFVSPARFDLDALLTGSGPPLAWHGDEPTRIALVPRNGTSADTQWIETDSFWAYHFANGFEDGDDIVVEFPWSSEFALKPGPNQTHALKRARIDVKHRTARFETLDDRITEFPRIDDRLTARAHRYFSVSSKVDAPPGQWNVLMRVDTHTGKIDEWTSGDDVFDEVVFAPAVGGPNEHGYYVTFRTHRTTMQSDWVVLDADDITKGPIARVPLPFRVPSGLHGNWFPPELF